jgi:hypothetical protein
VRQLLNKLKNRNIGVDTLSVRAGGMDENKDKAYHHHFGVSKISEI